MLSPRRAPGLLAAAVAASWLLVLAGCQQASVTTGGQRPGGEPPVATDSPPPEPPRGAPGEDAHGTLHGRIPEPFPVQAHTVAEGRALALERKCPLVLIFQKRGCWSCEEFVRVHLNDPAVREPLSRSCVVRKYYDNAERQEFDIQSTPLVVFYTYDPADGALHFADVIKGLLEVELVAKRARDVAAGRNRCQRAVDAAVAGDEEGRFVCEHYYAPYLDPDQSRMLRR